MTLVDMKKTKKQSELESKPVDINEKYPWGLRINLETAELKKLNLDPKNVQVGDTVSIMAEGKVTRVSISDEYQTTDKSVGIQIQKIGLDFSAMDELDWNTPPEQADKVLQKRRIIR